jgi:hypothetical protein
MSKDSIITGQSSGNLNFKTAQKMIHKLLTCERIKTDLDEGRIKGIKLNNEFEVKIKVYTKEELAKKLGITQEEFEKLKSRTFYENMANKISLPLIRLYCATKFVNEKHKVYEIL